MSAAADLYVVWTMYAWTWAALWHACTHCASDILPFALQEPKKVVEHYAAGEGEGEEAPKVSLPLQSNRAFSTCLVTCTVLT